MVERYLNEQFPKIQRFASKVGADMGFEDAAVVDLRERSGKTWSERGITPDVYVTGTRGRLNILSVVTPNGKLNDPVTEKISPLKNISNFAIRSLKAESNPFS